MYIKINNLQFYIESDFLNTVVNKVLEPQFTYM